jgi:hypothetical protein
MCCTLSVGASNAACDPTLSQGNENMMFGNDPWGPSINTHQHVHILPDDDDEEMTLASLVLPVNGGGSLMRYSPTACSEVGSPLDSPRCPSSSD